MGFQLALRLLKAGYDVTVWNRTRPKAEPLAESGGELPVRRPAVDPAALAEWETDPGPWRERALAAARYLDDEGRLPGDGRQ